MALSGNFLTSGWYSSTKKDYTYIKFSYTATQSVAGNYTDVAWQIAGSRAASGYVTCGGFRVTINGALALSINQRFDVYNGTVIFKDTTRIYHDNSGNANLSVTVEAGVYWNWQLSGSPTVSGSKTFTLDKIPRSATITAAPDFNDEGNPTITYSNPAGNAVTSLDACISLTGARDDIKYRSISKTGTSYTFTLTDDEREILRNGTTTSNSRTVIFYVRTNINGTLYNSTLYRTLTIVNAAPVINPVIEDYDDDVKSLTDGKALVRYMSDVDFVTGARGQKGATITSQSITCGGITVQGATGEFPEVPSGSFVFTATDSRGNTTTKQVDVPFVEYVSLSCSIGNNKPDTDGSFTLTATGTCYNGDISAAGSNDLYVLCRYKVSGGAYSDWYDMRVIKGDNSYTATMDFSGLDYRTTYVFQCRAGDLLAVVATDEVAIKSMPAFDWGAEDFNFNVPVKAPSLEVGELHLGGAPVDYIVEQGVKSSWLYRKWNSGIMECWRRVQVTINVSTAWGSLYSSGAISATNLTYPYAFIETPYLTANLMPFGSGGLLMAPGNQYGSATQTGAFEITRGSSITNSQYLIAYHAVGKWK